MAAGLTPVSPAGSSRTRTSASRGVSGLGSVIGFSRASIRSSKTKLFVPFFSVNTDIIRPYCALVHEPIPYMWSYALTGPVGALPGVKAWVATREAP